uniref:Uncharacterized protein n=1 Tax=Peronospora matthiolae TaxID=2874970 RepID=A0AAV1TE30_9STRA
MGMITQVNVFVDGICEGQTRLSQERAEPATLKEAFIIALREDFGVTKAYLKPSVLPLPDQRVRNLWRLMRLSRRVTDDVLHPTKATSVADVR